MIDKGLILSKERSFFFVYILDMSAVQDISIWKLTMVHLWYTGHCVTDIFSVWRAAC